MEPLFLQQSGECYTNKMTTASPKSPR